MYKLIFGQNGHFNKKNHVSFMPHTFSQSEYHFGQCGHFYQIESFEKLWFLVMVFLNGPCLHQISIICFILSQFTTYVLVIQTSTIQLQLVSLHSSSLYSSILFFSSKTSLRIYCDPRMWHNPWLILRVSKIEL